RKFLSKKRSVKTYQEQPQSKNTAFPHSHKQRMIFFKKGFYKLFITKETPQTNNESKNPKGFPPWNGQWQT
ncbi:hypothetical protein ACRFHZ_28715, partial [Klebsiella pneumoniae]